MIIGVTGPLGAGKDTAADYIAEKLNTTHISGGDVLREMLRGLGLDPKKSALGDFGTFLRTHYGGNIIPQLAEAQAGDVEHLVYSGFRSQAEALDRKKHGVVVYIDAPLELRYSRVENRARAHDSAHLEDLKKLDHQEHRSAAPMAENLEAVREIADVVIVNDGTLEQLHQKLDEFIAAHVH